MTATHHGGGVDHGRGNVVAVDLGGTTIKACRDPGGAVEIVATPASDAVLPAVVALVERLRTPDTVAVAVVTPGLVSDGMVRYAANLGWRDVPLRASVKRATGLPTAVEHDVVAAALAEDADELLFVSLGTGISAAYVHAGQVWRGANGWAGELGHVPVHPDGEACACGQRGCLERYASAAGIARRYRARTGTDRTAAELAGCDPAWDEAVEALAIALATETLVRDPALIVLGGGLAQAGERLLAPLRAALERRLAWRAPPPVRLSGRGAAAGRIGAVRLAWQLAAACAGGPR